MYRYVVLPFISCTTGVTIVLIVINIDCRVALIDASRFLHATQEQRVVHIFPAFLHEQRLLAHEFFSHRHFFKRTLQITPISFLFSTESYFQQNPILGYKINFYNN